MKASPVVYDNGFLRHVCQRKDIANIFRICREYSIKIARDIVDGRKTYHYNIFGRDFTLTF